MKRLVRRALARRNLLDNAVYVSAHARDFRPERTWNNLRTRVRGAPDGLPVPPMRLVWVTLESLDLRTFLESGQREFEEVVLPLLDRNGISPTALATILDFGCGCGRLVRQWRARIAHGMPMLVGVDCDPRMVRWCEQHLPFAEFAVNDVSPPLAFDDGQFDLIYSRSVFTHFPESLQDEWLAEVWRVLKPGGWFLFTVRGDSYRDVMHPEDLAAYDQGEFVVRDVDNPGRNECFAYHPEGYVRSHWPRRGFEILDYEPGRRALREFRFQETYLAARR